MMKQQVQNLLLVAVSVAQKRPHVAPGNIATNLGKLQRLAVSLKKRWETTAEYEWAQTADYAKQTRKLEDKVTELGDAIGVGVMRDGMSLSFDLYGHQHRLF